MPKLLKYIIIIALILIAIFAILKFTNKEKGEEITNNQGTPKKVFEDPLSNICVMKVSFPSNFALSNVLISPLVNGRDNEPRPVCIGAASNVTSKPLPFPLPQ